MEFITINPATGEALESYPVWSVKQLVSAIDAATQSFVFWSILPIPRRAELLVASAEILKNGRERFARLITLEMGKLIGEARSEIDKCIWALEYFSAHGEQLLAEEMVSTEAARSFVTYQPLGTILAVMPWNFPFWQVFRAAVPILLAGNTVLISDENHHHDPIRHRVPILHRPLASLHLASRHAPIRRHPIHGHNLRNSLRWDPGSHNIRHKGDSHSRFHSRRCYYSRKGNTHNRDRLHSLGKLEPIQRQPPML